MPETLWADLKVGAGVGVLLMILAVRLYQAYLRAAMRYVIGLAVTGGVVSQGIVFYQGLTHGIVPEPRWGQDLGFFWWPMGQIVWVGAVNVTVFAGVGIIAKVYLAWRGRDAAASLREGWQAVVGHGVSVAALGAAVWVVRGTTWALWAAAVGAGGLLLRPLVGVLRRESGVRTQAVEEERQLADERQRVLTLVEGGKISGEEATELIAALGKSHQRDSETTKGFSLGRRLMLAGGLLVLVGFVVPWLKVDIKALAREEMKAVMDAMPEEAAAWSREMQGEIEGEAAGFQGQQRAPFPQGVAWSKPMYWKVAAGDMAYGMGWIVLFLGVGVAALPMIWPMDRTNATVQRALSLVGLLIGTLIVGYLIIEEWRWVYYGFVVESMGYAMLWAGALREYLDGR